MWVFRKLRPELFVQNLGEHLVHLNVKRVSDELDDAVALDQDVLQMLVTVLSLGLRGT